MNKIICDVCGTSYPETATQCPICGCVRPGEVHTIDGDFTEQMNSPESGTYTYVKGGRFSKGNVRKRMRASQGAATEDNLTGEAPEKTTKKDKGLLITVVMLLLAIIAVVIYIVVHFFMPGNLDQKDPVDQTTAAQTTAAEETTEPTSLDVPCEELLIDTLHVQLEAVDASWQLNVQALPEDTTDELLYESSDPSVATVSEDGLVTAVSDGVAEIRITCGSVELVCEITCSVTEETTASTEETETTTVPEVVFELNRKDFSLFFAGDSWNVYSGDLDPKTISWSSANEKVVTITDGVVKAVGPGDTTIYGEYNGTKISCAVHCKFSATQVAPPTGGTYSISHKEVTLRLEVPGYTQFVLTLNDEQGRPVNVTWQTTNSCCSVSGNLVKGLTTGKTQIYTVYNGIQYSCDVFVYLH